MTMRSYQPNGHLEMLTEDALLRRVLGQQNGLGNRIWVLYGAPGSGKSELIKWLETRILQEEPQRGQVMVRISRHELDVLSIVNRFLTLLPNQFLNETTTQRWSAARQKSRTVTKMILLFALENLLDSDDLINALFYRLLNALQPHVDRILAFEPGDIDESMGVELIGQETWSAILRETSLPVPVAYEQFRHQLTTAFRDHLLEGLSLAETMQRISYHCQAEQGQRPLLLVDDLVQSLNIFATDLLDYLLTLEAGNWDVVLGLTPAAFEDSLRGRGLLQRISHLDTIDDRVGKMWLSDETGKESYVLTEANCDEFASRYLTEMNDNTVPGLPYFPFTREALVRIYRALPAGKGKVRYFVRYLHEILRRTTTGEDPLDVLVDFARPEYIARVEDSRLARLCEFYGPLLEPDSDNLIALPGTLLLAFAITAEQRAIPVEPLIRFYQPREATSSLIIEDESQMVVRDWLLGKSVNRQMLRSLRQGAARWLRTVQPIDWIYREHVAKPRGALRWRKTYLDVRLPIYLEGVDEAQDGIALTRDIGMIAFDLCRYGTATGSETKKLQEQLATAKELVSLQMTADNYRQRVRLDLETQLGMKVELLALVLQTFALVVKGEGAYRLPGFPADFWCWVNDTHQRYRWRHEQISDRSWQAFQFLFDDFFELRQGFYDSVLIGQLLKDVPYETWFSRLAQMDVSEIDKDYLLEGRPLANVLSQVQRYIEQCEQAGSTTLSDRTSRVVDAWRRGESVALTEVSPEVQEEIRMLVPDVYTALRLHLVETEEGSYKERET
ncbi:MAG: hypothetical protein IPM39_27590 [Chloroflexi bacterium]|nr:hypothetical protein [Chloroflexota bacterium]